MLKIENLVAAVLDTHVWVWSAAGDARVEKLRGFSGSAMVLGIPLITADARIVEWNANHRMAQVIAL